MSLQSLLAILGSVVVTALAQLCMKIASRQFSGEQALNTLAGSLFQQMLHPLSLVAMLAYAVSLVLWFLALRNVPLSVAYPFAGLTLALVALLGVGVLGEAMTMR
jgi:undecaprenyl phosphate-alpha-L-ara4N flippase subunit ArnF